MQLRAVQIQTYLCLQHSIFDFKVSNNHEMSFNFNFIALNVTHTGHQRIVRLLIQNGADINAANRNNKSALSSAINSGKFFVERKNKPYKLFYLGMTE